MGNRIPGRKVIQIIAGAALLAVTMNGCRGRNGNTVEIVVVTTEAAQGIGDAEVSSGAEIVRMETGPVTETGAEIETELVKQTGSVTETETVTQTAGDSGHSESGSGSGAVLESLIYGQGMTLETRFLPPAGYERIPADGGSLLAFLRGQDMKEDGSPVLLYNGAEKANQSAQAAVFAMPGFDSDLQQCADSVIRMYAEYFWSVGAYDKIGFHLTNGFFMDYPTWREGNRLSVDGNNVSWVKKASYDDSYETFLLYLKYVMMYAGTLSMDGESEPVDAAAMQAGDLFLKGGSPGHCVMVTDVAADKDGNLCYLLSQSYMPAQDFHVLKNPLHEGNPWYYESELEYPLKTPEYVFQEGSFQRWYGFR